VPPRQAHPLTIWEHLPETYLEGVMDDETVVREAIALGGPIELVFAEAKYGPEGIGPGGSFSC
jgi:hypothetical protein